MFLIVLFPLKYELIPYILHMPLMLFQRLCTYGINVSLVCAVALVVVSVDLGVVWLTLLKHLAFHPIYGARWVFAVGEDLPYILFFSF